MIIILSRGFREHEDVCAYWHWTVDDAGVSKRQEHYEGHINSLVEAESGGSDIRMFAHHYYFLFGNVSAYGTTMTLTMQNRDGGSSTGVPVSKSATIHMELVYDSDPNLTEPCYVYTGTLNFSPPHFSDEAVNELITIAVPNDFKYQRLIIALWQWSNSAKTNFVYIDDVNETETGSTAILCFQNDVYPMSGAVASDRSTMTLTIAATDGYECKIDLTLRCRRPRRKKRGLFWIDAEKFVTNDLSETYHCTLSQWEADNPVDYKSLLLGIYGLNLTVAGIVLPLLEPASAVLVALTSIA